MVVKKKKCGMQLYLTSQHIIEPYFYEISDVGL